MKLYERSSYLTTFACQFSRYRYKRFLFGAVPTGDMFQRKIHEIFKNLPNVFGIADAILFLEIHMDSKDHDDTLQKVKICKQVHLKLNKNKCHFR